MIAVSIFGAPAWLVPYGPNTDDNVTVKASIEVDGKRGQTGRSSRRPQAYHLRHEQTWTTKMAPADFFTARAATLEAQDEPIVAPFWMAARPVTAAALMTSGLTLAWTADWATTAINPVSLVGYDFFAPLLMGTLMQPPRLVSSSSDYVTAEFILAEQASADAAIVAPAAVDVTLATPDAFAAPLFPFSPDAGTAPKLSLGQIDVEKQPLGPGRIPADIYYPQARETVVQPTYKLKSSADVAALLGWWFRRAGGADACWVATTQKIGDMTGDLAAGATTVPTVAPMSVAVGDTLALLTTGHDAEFVRVQSIVAGVPHLAGPTAIDHPKAWTTIVPALLARHTDVELTISLIRAASDWIANVTIGFREVVPEYAATDGEVRGTTLGRLSPWAWLMQVDLDYAGATQTWRMTNWESGATTPDTHVWEYRDFDFDHITQSTDLEDDTCTVKIRWWAGCPWENWLPGKLAATGKLTLYRSAVAADGTIGAQAAVWSGVLAAPSREGPILSVKVLGANAIFSQRTPHAQCTPTCWKRLYGVKCTLALADWKFNAIVTAIAGQSVTIGTITRANGGGLPAGFGGADWFGLGFAQWTNGSGQPLRAEVIASTAIAGGTITLTLGSVLGCAVGDAVVVAPGCDKTIGTCDARFGNRINFGGFFAMPAVSPSFKIPNSTNTPAKK